MDEIKRGERLCIIDVCSLVLGWMVFIFSIEVFYRIRVDKLPEQLQESTINLVLHNLALDVWSYRFEFLPLCGVTSIYHSCSIECHRLCNVCCYFWTLETGIPNTAAQNA
jgi:hypothetical protein